MVFVPGFVSTDFKVDFPGALQRFPAKCHRPNRAFVASRTQIVNGKIVRAIFECGDRGVHTFEAVRAGENLEVQSCAQPAKTFPELQESRVVQTELYFVEEDQASPRCPQGDERVKQPNDAPTKRLERESRVLVGGREYVGRAVLGHHNLNVPNPGENDSQIVN